MALATGTIGETVPRQLPFIEFDSEDWDFWPFATIAPAADYAFATWLRDLLCAEVRFAGFLLQQPLWFVHVLHFTQASLRHRLDHDVARPHVLARHLMATPWQKVLQQLVRPFSDDLPGIVERMHPFGWDYRAYHTITGLARDAGARRCLLAQASITPELVELLGALPPGFRYAPALCVTGARFDESAIADVVEMLLECVPQSAPELRAEFSALESSEALSDWIDNAEYRLEWPAAPWPGTPRLHPLAGGSELRALCVAWPAVRSIGVTGIQEAMIYPYLLSPSEQYAHLGPIPVLAVDDGGGRWTFEPFGLDAEMQRRLNEDLARQLAGTVHRVR